MEALLERINRQSPLLFKGFLFGLWIGLPTGTFESKVVGVLVVGFFAYEFAVAVRTLRNQGWL
jgi:hypothetical protein